MTHRVPSGKPEPLAHEDRDPLWRSTAYLLSLHLYDQSWDDAMALYRHPLTRGTAAQLYDAVGSIQANISEGYSRCSGRDRSRVLEYALGSTREARCWYRGARHILPHRIILERMEILGQVCSLLLTTIPRERGRRIERSHRV